MALILRFVAIIDRLAILTLNFPLLIYHNQSLIFRHRYRLVSPYIFSNNLLHSKVFPVLHKVQQAHELIGRSLPPFQDIFEILPFLIQLFEIETFFKF